MTKRTTIYGGIIAAIILANPTVTTAQIADTAALMDRIERLERDIRTLNVQIARGGSGGGSEGAAASIAGGADPAYARLSVRLSELEGDVRNLTGKLEEISFKLGQISQQMEKVSSDTDFRLGQLERGGMANQPAQAMRMPSGADQTQNTMQASEMASGTAAPAQPGAGLPDGSRVLGTLTQSEAEAAPTVETPAAPASEADALLAQLTGDGPAITGVGADGAPITSEPTPPPAPAPAPQAAPSSPGVNVAGSAQPVQTSGTQMASLPEGSVRDKYMYAFGLLRQGKYEMASQTLRQFLEQHGDDKLAANARYWLGETYYVRGAYVEAAETFLEGYQTDPQGPKAPDALLKLGMSLSSLDKKQEACSAFQKLRADYPNAPAGLKSTLRREWQKNGCV